ncbi:hypothetical protein DENSPDRAFT_218756 [Dentipellis sp. KUC8613]|nr:hypothetical protein DENSPDRAFT_218756 [Dentipellis sp. KUC8613]
MAYTSHRIRSAKMESIKLSTEPAIRDIIDQARNRHHTHTNNTAEYSTIPKMSPSFRASTPSSPRHRSKALKSKYTEEVVVAPGTSEAAVGVLRLLYTEVQEICNVAYDYQLHAKARRL